eukprot:845663-Pyramimonas_sp.AAC.1
MHQGSRIETTWGLGILGAPQGGKERVESETRRGKAKENKERVMGKLEQGGQREDRRTNRGGKKGMEWNGRTRRESAQHQKRNDRNYWLTEASFKRILSNRAATRCSYEGTRDAENDLDTSVESGTALDSEGANIST